MFSEQRSYSEHQNVGEIVRLMTLCWPKKDSTRVWLTTCTKFEDAVVRHVALQELARGWKDDPETLPWLKDRARLDEKLDVCLVAVQELAEGWKGHPEVESFLNQLRTKN